MPEDKLRIFYEAYRDKATQEFEQAARKDLKDAGFFDEYLRTEENIRMMEGETMNYCEVQKIAKDTIAYIKTVIEPGMSLKTVRRLCEDKMMALGADSFWYWGIGALVFAGDDTTVSVSGREYVTSDRLVDETDIITVDLSPQVGDIWGDYARTIILENGNVVQSVNEVSRDEWRVGLAMEIKLHERMAAFVTPETSFEELYFRMNDYITAEGFINLDFAGNLGHSIVRRKEDRIYIEKGNKARLGDVSCFTFEPHISTAGSKYGYKRENIYYFDNGRIKELSNTPYIPMPEGRGFTACLIN